MLVPLPRGFNTAYVEARRVHVAIHQVLHPRFLGGLK